MDSAFYKNFSFIDSQKNVALFFLYKIKHSSKNTNITNLVLKLIFFIDF